MSKTTKPDVDLNNFDETKHVDAKPQKATIGRIVHFVLSNREIRPAILTRIWTDTMAQLHVFPDSHNDGDPGVHLLNHNWDGSSVHLDATKTPLTWHWPERS